MWDEHFHGSTKTLDVHVAALRKKVAEVDADLQISSVRGIGYRLDTK